MGDYNPYKVDSDADSESDQLLGRLAARRRAGNIGAVALLLAIVVGGGWAVMSISSSDDAETVYNPPLAEETEPVVLLSNPVDAEALASIDMGLVHGELFPTWMIRAGNARYARDWERAGYAFDDLLGAVEADANLVEILLELESQNDVGSITDPERVLTAYTAWNEYLDDNDIPFYVHPVVRFGRDKDWVTVKFYETIHDINASWGEHDVRVLLMERADHTNIRELYLGKAGDARGARVITDRVSDFALNEVWPLIATGGIETLDPIQVNFSTSVRAELASLLPPEALDVLRRTARQRGQLLAVADALKARRRGCGSRYSFNFVPWNGVSDETRERTLRYAELDAGQDCPRVTVTEAHTLDTVSRELAAELELEGALRQLISVVSRGTAVHEAQHLVDQNFRGERLSCDGCERNISGDSLQELSAYLASFSDPQAGGTALFQACTYFSDAGGEHERALNEALPAILPLGCVGAIPTNIPAAAQSVTEQLLGQWLPIQLPHDYPTELPIGR